LKTFFQKYILENIFSNIKFIFLKRFSKIYF